MSDFPTPPPLPQDEPLQWTIVFRPYLDALIETADRVVQIAARYDHIYPTGFSDYCADLRVCADRLRAPMIADQSGPPTVTPEP